MDYATPQEAFWAGDFGTEYITRNRSKQLHASNLNFFTHALARAGKLSSCVELGANIGMNLRALKSLYPGIETEGIEINADAARELSGIADRVTLCSILDWEPVVQVDLAFTKTVLIHINPDHLPGVYDKIYSATTRFIMVAEYYNPSPVAITYRGVEERLFKRDFAGELMDRYPLQLIDYGFVYRHDRAFPQDDINWFLMEKV